MNSNIDKKMVTQLQALYKNDQTVKALLDWFGERRKDSRMMPARVATNNTGADYTDIIRVFRQFDEMGIGTFLVGRKGSESRIQWHYSIRSLAEAAKGNAEVVEAPRVPEGQALEDEFDEAIFAADMVQHSFQIRPDLKLTFTLPSDISAKEADRIAQFVKTLPFES